MSASAAAAVIDESRLQQIERELAGAGAREVAAIAFAAIFRIGEIGAPATAAFGRLAGTAFHDPDFPDFGAGLVAIADLLRREAPPAAAPAIGLLS